MTRPLRWCARAGGYGCLPVIVAALTIMLALVRHV